MGTVGHWAVALGVAVSFAVAPATAAAASSPADQEDPGCQYASVDTGSGYDFGDVCTLASADNPFVGWYSDEGSAGATVRIGLRVDGGGTTGTRWTGPLQQPGDGGVAVHDWTDEPFRVGYCYTGLVEISGVVAEAPGYCR